MESASLCGTVLGGSLTHVIEGGDESVAAAGMARPNNLGRIGEPPQRAATLERLEDWICQGRTKSLLVPR